MSHKLVSFDWAIKKILRSKANFGILEGFLSELLNRNVKIIELLESESNKEDKHDKFNKVDILVSLDDGEIVLIEVQISNQPDYFHRMLFGVSKIVTGYLNAGDPYSKIKKIYSVNIVYFDLGHGDDYVYHGTTSFLGIHKHDLLDLSTTQKLVYKKEDTYQIYPEYYLIKVNEFNDIAKNTLDEWIYFLKNEEVEDTFNARGLSEAKDKLDKMKLSPTELETYTQYAEDYRCKISTETSMYAEGMAKGKIEGEQIGIEKGKMEGKIEIARSMKASGMTDEMIKKITGLNVSDFA